mgnify:CR=1 FL=1
MLLNWFQTKCQISVYLLYNLQSLVNVSMKNRYELTRKKNTTTEKNQSKAHFVKASTDYLESYMLHS